MSDETVEIDYTNHRGERAWRRVRPVRLFFGADEWHKETQWLLDAIDLEKRVQRTFAMKDIHEWRRPACVRAEVTT